MRLEFDDLDSVPRRGSKISLGTYATLPSNDPPGSTESIFMIDAFLEKAMRRSSIRSCFERNLGDQLEQLVRHPHLLHPRTRFVQRNAKLAHSCPQFRPARLPSRRRL